MFGTFGFGAQHTFTVVALKIHRLKHPTKIFFQTSETVIEPIHNRRPFPAEGAR
jgi:hypothetical protein